MIPLEVWERRGRSIDEPHGQSARGSRYDRVKVVDFGLARVLEVLGARTSLRRAPETVGAPTFTPLTCEKATIWNGRFAPDGQVVYAAAWDGGPIRATPDRQTLLHSYSPLLTNLLCRVSGERFAVSACETAARVEVLGIIRCSAGQYGTPGAISSRHLRSAFVAVSRRLKGERSRQSTACASGL